MATSEETQPLPDLGDFRKVFDDYYPRLRAFFLSSGFPVMDAEDLSQVTLVNVYRTWSQYRGEGSLGGWIFAAARNQARDAWRRRSRRGEDPLELDAELESAEPAPDEAVADRDELERTIAALGRLPAGMRSCLLLHVQKGLSYSDVADRLGLSERTVKVQIWNARRRLRELVGRER